MPYFGQEVFEMAQKKGSLTRRKYKKALAKCNRLSRKNIDKIIKKYKLDAIIAPTGGPAWSIDLINGDHFGGMSSSSPAAVAGYPNITVPAGYVHELPIGISFFSGAFQEPTLLKIAYAYEQATKIRQPPKFLPTLPI